MPTPPPHDSTLIPTAALAKLATSPDDASETQQTFNQLTQDIRALQQTLAQWQAAVAAYRERHVREVLPQLEQLRAVYVDLVRLLDAHAALKLAKADRAVLEEQIVDLAEGLVDSLQDPRLRQEMQGVVQRYAPDVPDPITPSPAEGHRDRTSEPVEPSSDESWEQIEARLEHERQQAEQARERQRAQRQKKKASPQQRQEQVLAQQAGQSVRDVFRKLASALHPDREPDAALRERKTALMQQANRAYADSDLMTLLQLQLQAELIDAEQLARLGDARLAHYNRVLAGQVQSLQAEVVEIEQDFRATFGIEAKGTLKPAQIASHLNRQLQRIQADAHQLRMDLRALAEPELLKQWLKHQRTSSRRGERMG